MAERPSYDGFSIVEKTETVENKIIPLYHGVPLDGANSDSTYFCFVGNGYGNGFIELDTLKSRLGSEALRKADSLVLSAKPLVNPFGFWNRKGKPVDINPKMVQKLKSGSKTGWDSVRDLISIATEPLPENQYGRFMSPKQTGKITLYFVPSVPPTGFEDGWTKLFQDVLTAATPKFPKSECTYVVISKEEAEDRKLVYTGSHFLYFYSTWMDYPEYKKLWEDRVGDGFMRDWPSQTQVETMHGKLTLAADNKQFDTIQLSHVKAKGAIGMRDPDMDLAKVMGVGATRIAEEWWGEKDLKAAAAEWLHRSAFSFGGLYEKVDVKSSQNQNNLIFGTKECNTHMIRAENTITTLLRADYAGTLLTKNIFKGKVRCPEIIPEGYKCKDIDRTDENHTWLCFALTYGWTGNPPQGSQKPPFIVETKFNPFSRYIPFEVEGRLDDILLTRVLDQGAQTASSSHVKSVDLTLPAFTGRNKSIVSHPSYQEPTIVWNAAQQRFPYVHAGTAKIISPEIAEEPTQHDEPDEEQVVKVKGAKVLFSHKEEDKPVKAVRVVQLNLASKKRQAQPLDAPAPVSILAKRLFLGPILAEPALDVPQGGFVVVGQVDLFGIPDLSTKFEKWEGPAPSHVDVDPYEPVAVERATLANDIRLSTLVPELKGTAFDTITFRDVTVYHQNYQFDTTKAVGWHFGADLVINESCGALREVLSTVLGVDEPTLSVYLFLGTGGGWHKPPSLHSFVLEGVFAGLASKPIDGVVLSKIGIRLFGIRTMKFDPKPRSALTYGFAVFGSMNLDVPGSVVPLTLDYEIREYGGILLLGASVQTWQNPFGAGGLELSDISFVTSFALSSPWKSLTFHVSANLDYEDISTTFQGTFSPSGAIQLQASIYNVTMGTIDTLFRCISGDSGELALPDVDLSIGTATVAVSNNGFSISVDEVKIGDYTSFGAGLAITSHNVTLNGKLTTDAVEFGDVELKGAFVQITFEKQGSGKTTDLIIGGKVAFSKLEFDAAVHLYKSPDRSAKSLAWTVLAALTVGNNELALSKVVPEVQGTSFDLALTQAVFVAASRDDPALGNMISTEFTFHQGVQICAVLNPIDALNSLMRGPVPGLTISAGWSKARGFDLQVYMPTPTRLNLGNGVTTTPFTLAIATKPEVQLILSAGLKVPVAHSPEPLLFTLSLGASFTSAQATGQMSGWWVNPLGISKNVKVGPNLGLSISVLYATFLATGLPSGFAIQGGLMIGQTEAQLALSINEDPMKVLLSAGLERLNVVDLVVFASDIIDTEIPKPSPNLLDFQKIQLYICPAGVTIGTTFYPQGFSFQADVILFEKRADIKCVVDTGGISLKGGIDNFVLGPLTVRGTTGPRAVIECELGPAKQHLLIDGVVSLFGLETTARIEVGILPTPKFDWFTQLKFTDVLLFQLRAALVGAVSFKDLSDADFVFDALFEQHILEYIHKQLTEQFAQARRAAKDGIDAAKKDVDEAKVAWRAGVDRAQTTLDEKKKTWDAKNESITASSNKIINDFNEEISRLQGEITSAQNKYNKVMTDAQSVVSAAQRDRAQALQSARHDVNNAKRKVADDINAAQRDVDKAEREFNAAFGSANASIESARRDVQSIQNEIDGVYRTIREYEDAPGIEFWKKLAIPGLYIAIGTLEASRAVADGALQAAQAVLMSTNFLAGKAAFETAKGALIFARETGQAGLDVAIGALAAADATSQAALDLANETLEITKVGVEWGVLETAKQALQIFKDVNDKAFRAATQALVDLIKCAEYLAYKAATAALDLARSATVALDAAKAALDVAQEAIGAALAIGEWVVDHVLTAFDIQVVRLSGSLRGMIGAGGEMAQPFTVYIQGVIAGQPFTLRGEFNLGKVADFITMIFKYLWDEIKKVLGL
ncbi:hypothetical protein BDV93DRAFT_529669 [Ceratobasidium sp. AG-I]|nr:hypothetical protein BDV93DRAFT_529669 [Ceratobasidium sp. AG-I]